MKKQLKFLYLLLVFFSIFSVSLVLSVVQSQAAISFVETSQDSGGNTTSIDIAKPSGVVAGDVMLAQITIAGGAADTITPPDASWFLINRTSSGTTLSQAIYYRIAVNAAAATYTWSFSKRRAIGGIVAYRGVDVSASPINASGGRANGSSTSVTAPSITTTVDNTMLVGFFGTNTSTSFSGIPIGMTVPPRYSIGSGGSSKTIMASDETWSTFSATFTRVATAAAAAVNIGHLVALKPSTQALDHFHVEAIGGGSIADQTAGLAFNIRITAHTLTEAVYTGFTDTVDITSTGTLSAGGGTTASFVNGVLASHSVTIINTGTFTITATNTAGTGETGTSNSFLVIAGAPAKLQILVPGETAAPGTAGGKTGTPTAQNEGVAFTVTVNAVDANWNVVTSITDTVAITSSDGAADLPSNAPLVSGTMDFSVTLNTPGTATVTASDITDSGKSPNTSPDITINAVGGNFNAYETSTGGGAIDGVIKTKVAGPAFDLDIIAIKSGAIDTNYKQTVQIKLLDSSDNTGTIDPATACLDTWTNIQTLSPNTTFTGGDNGRKTVSFTETNSWPDVRVMVTSVTGGSKIGCSKNNFAIRPASFSSISIQDADWQTAGTTRTLNNTSASGGVVHKAGRPFRITATAVNSASNTTTNYTGSPTANITAYIEPVGGTAGTMTIGASAVSGVLTSTTATYDDVGSFTMQLEDLTFADVDVADSSTAERYITSSTFNVGRFVPDYFDVAASNTPQFATFNDTVCGSRSFTYIGQPFGYTTLPQSLVTARNFSGNTTINYTGSLQHITAADVIQTYTNNDAASTPALTSTVGSATRTANGDGTVTVTPAATDTLAFTRRAENLIDSNEIPFNADISLTVSVVDSSESDGNITSATTAFFDGTGTGIAFDSGSGFRYGHLALANAFGPETEPLVMKTFAQYYDSTQEWSANTADNCTSLVYASKTESDITVTESIAIGATLTLSSGQGSFILTPATDAGDPGGTVTIKYSGLDSKPWLDFDSDPNHTDKYAEAKFGIYRGNDRIINFQEIMR